LVDSKLKKKTPVIITDYKESMGTSFMWSILQLKTVNSTVLN